MSNQKGKKQSRITIYSMSSNQPTSELQHAQKVFRDEGYLGPVSVERIFRLEGKFDHQKIEKLLANTNSGESLKLIKDPDELFTKQSIEVSYRPAVIDPETLSGLEAAKLLGVSGLEYIRLSYRYTATELNYEEIERIAKKHLYNPVVQIIVGKNDYRETLHPKGKPEPIKFYDLTGLNEEELIELSASASWYAPLAQMKAVQAQQEKIGRPWIDAELEMIFQSWGDHCFHTTWKGMGLFDYLKKSTFEIDHPLCKDLPVFIDNSGPMLFYDGHVLIIKFESHNHPSSVYTKGGIETKHGGLFRDLMEFGKGSYPLCGATIMGTMLPSLSEDLVPKGALHPRRIVLESIAGTASYCNPMGIPMAYTDYQASTGYAKCWALGGGIGFAPLDTIIKDEPQKGDEVILFGGKTGRDGVHGATASSAELTAEMVIKEGASVQIGHPIIERNEATVIPILRDKGKIKFITDLGAGGISCAVGETIANCGADIDLTNLPLKDKSLSSWEKWVSESQERGLCVVKAEDVDEVIQIFAQYDVEAFVLGTCRDDMRLVVTDNGETVVDLDLDFLWHGCPIGTLTTEAPKIVRTSETPQSNNVLNNKLLLDLVEDYSLCDQSFATNQFDSTVQGRTVVGPLINGVPSDAFVCTPFYDKPYGAVMTVAYNSLWSETDPVGSVKCLMDLAISKAVAIGVSPDDMAFCGNYYTPTRTPGQRWHLSQMVHKAADTAVMYKIPFVSGKDSSSGTFTDEFGHKIDVPMTFVPSIMGRIPNYSKVINKVFKNPYSQIFIIRPRHTPNMAGSVASKLINGYVNNLNALPGQDLLKDTFNLWHYIDIFRENFESIAAIGKGGAFMQILYGTMASRIGARINLEPTNAIWNLLGECPASFLVTTKQPGLTRNWFENKDYECIPIGCTTENPTLEILVDNRYVLRDKKYLTLVDTWKNAFTKELNV